jgi:hypothetical protein
VILCLLMGGAIPTEGAKSSPLRSRSDALPKEQGQASIVVFRSAMIAVRIGLGDLM